MISTAVSTYVQICQRETALTHTLVQSCRIIMNMRRFQVEPRCSNGVTSDDFRLSTIIRTSHGTQEDVKLKLPS
jgi:hypothetical protein